MDILFLILYLSSVSAAACSGTLQKKVPGIIDSKDVLGTSTYGPYGNFYLIYDMEGMVTQINPGGPSDFFENTGPA